MARQGSSATASRLGRRLEAGPRSPAARAMASRTGRDPLLTCVALVVLCGVVLGCVFSGLDSSWPPAASLPFQLALIVLVLRGFFRSVRAERNRLEGIPDSRTRRQLFVGWDYDDLVGRAVAYYRDYQGRQVTPVARDDRVTCLLVSPPAGAAAKVAAGDEEPVAEQQATAGDDAATSRVVAIFNPEGPTPSGGDIALIENVASENGAAKCSAVARHFEKDFAKAALAKNVFMIDDGNISLAATRGFVFVTDSDEAAPSDVRIVLRSIPMAFGLRPL
ncbi:MAG: hypothetical protein ACLPQS_04580 [Acidimicrobiales bacterium]